MRKYFLTLLTLTINNYLNVNVVSVVTSSKTQSNLQITETYAPIDDINYIKKGGIHSATWYNPHGARTASGERFHKDSLTAAYNFSKMGSYLRVTNIYDSSSVVVRVTDRMGNKSKNHIDLSKCAFDSIGNPKAGRIRVIVEELQ